MRVTALAVVIALAGCGGGGGASDVASVAMALAPDSGLSPSDIGAVELLVFDGASAGCARVMMGTSPLDDASLVLVAHALFTIDSASGGAPKHLAVAAGKPLDFYAEAFRTAAPNRTRIGRGCVTQTLGGSAAGVTITLAASE